MDGVRLVLVLKIFGIRIYLRIMHEIMWHPKYGWNSSSGTLSVPSSTIVPTMPTTIIIP